METNCQQCGQALIAGPGESMFCASCAMNDFLNEAADVPTLVASAPVSAKGRAVIEGHELIEELARGGMGVVYKARQLSPRRDVALKMLLPVGDKLDEFRERFRLEARALAELDHPSILPLYVAGEHEGMPFFTMKLALGGSLAQLLKAGKKLDFKTIANLIATLGEAVFYANQRGILHRDIKPGNILFDENQQPFLADFGLAKLIGGDPANTMSMAAMGTPCYMAPEVATHGAKSATASSDVYGLGAVLYELLAGKPPFQVEGLGAILKKVAEEAPEAPSTLAKGVPRDLEVICLTCLAKDPKKRYSTAQALSEDLQRWLHGEPITARRVGPAERLWSWAKRHPGLAGMSAALLVTLSAGSAWLWVQNLRLDAALVKESQAKREALQNNLALQDRIEFLTGDFADYMESIGRIDLLEMVWKDLDKTYSLGANLNVAASGQLRRSRLLSRWSRAQQLQGESQSAVELAQRAVDAVADASTLPDYDTQQGIEALGTAKIAMAEAQAGRGDFQAAMQTLDFLSQSPSSEPIPLLSAEVELAKTATILRINSSSEIGEEASKHAELALTSAQQAFQSNSKSAISIEILGRSLLAKAETTLAKLGMMDAPAMANFETLRANAPLSLYKNAAEFLANAMKETPKNSSLTRHYNDAVSSQIYILNRMPGREMEAEQSLRANVARLKLLADQDPLNWRWKLDLADAYSASATLFRRKGELPEELSSRTQSCETARLALEAAPEGYRPSLLVIRSEKALGELHLKQGNVDAGKRSFEISLQTAHGLLARHGHKLTEVLGYKKVMEEMLGELAKVSPDAGIELSRREMSWIEEFGGTSPSSPWVYAAAAAQRRLASAHKARGDFAEAMNYTQQALLKRVALLRQTWEPERLDGDVWHGYQEMAKLQVHENMITEALETAEQALAIRREFPHLKSSRHQWCAPLLEVLNKALSTGGPTTVRAESIAGLAYDLLYGPDQPKIESAEDQLAAGILEKSRKLPAEP